MSNYGMTEGGYIIKPFEVIVQEIQDSITTKLGNDIILVPEDPLKEIVDAFAEREYNLLLQQVDIYNSQYITKASGVSLDYAVEMVNIRRNGAIKGFISQQAWWGDEASTVATGTRVSTSADSTIEWETLTDGVLGPGTDGTWEIEYSDVPTEGDFKIGALGQYTITLPYNASASEVEDALNDLVGMYNATVIDGPDTEHPYEFTFEAQQVTLSIIHDMKYSSTVIDVDLTEGTIGEPHAIIPVTATIAGEQPANAFAVNTITTQSGSNIAETLNMEAATSGSEIETDADLRARALTAYQIVKYATLEGLISGLEDSDYLDGVSIIENDTGVAMFPGTANEIPSHSFKPYLFPKQTLTTEQEEELAKDIFERKPCGIQSVGDEVYTIQDSQGYDKVIGFSYAGQKNIYLDVALTTNADFPVDGIAGLSEQLVEWGNGLGPGEDVIVHGSNSVCGQISLYPGITSYTLKIGIAPNPTGTSNVDIDDGTTSGTIEVSSWDLSRLGITEV